MMKTYRTWTAQSQSKGMALKGARDSFFIRQDGHLIFDLSSTSFQTSFGHSFGPLKRAIAQQMEVMNVSFPKGDLPFKEKVSEQLLRLLKKKDGKIFYTVSGSEAVENALKIVRQIKKNPLVLAQKESYHGASLGALSVTGDWRNEAHQTVDEWTLRFPAPRLDPQGKELEKILEQNRVSALIIETISGVNGVYAAPLSWWQKLEELKEKYQFYLILDEVLCGFWRTGSAFAFHQFPVTPDLVCMSKAMTGGYIPFGAVWTNEQIAQYYDQHILSCGLTHYAHPLGLSCTEVVCDYLETSTARKKIAAIEKMMREFSQELKKIDLVQDVRLHGALMAVDLVKRAWDSEELWERGVFVVMKENRAIISPPLTSAAQDLSRALAIFKEWVESYGEV